MTLDVVIGKVIVYTKTGVLIDVEPCPVSDEDICDKECTMFPKTSKRSGSTNFWNFFKEYCHDIYYDMRRYPNTNDTEIVYLKFYIDSINNLTVGKNDKCNIDRMKWFKYWCNKAIELYGNDAGIMFY